MMDIPSSTNNDRIAEIDLPMSSPEPVLPRREEPLSRDEVDTIRQRNSIDNENKNQNLARTLIKWFMIGMGIVYVGSLATSTWLPALTDIPEKIFPLIQAAFFTFLGYLFGEKGSGSK